MAETQIFQTRKDFKNLVEFLFDEFNATLVSAKSFTHSKGEYFTTYEQVETFIDKTKDTIIASSAYYIVSDQWSVEPIYFSLVKSKNNEQFYASRQKYGGPSIELRPSYHGVIHDPIDKIISGSISDYPYYISGSFLRDRENGYRTIDRPKEMNNAMKKIKAFVKRNGKMVAYRKSNFVRTGLAMTESLILHQKGVKLLMGGMEFEIEKKN